MAAKKVKGLIEGKSKKTFGGKIFTFDGYVMETYGRDFVKEELQRRGYLIRTRKGGKYPRSYEIWKRRK